MTLPLDWQRARLLAWTALSDDERAAIRAARDARKRRKAEKREADVDKARLIFKLSGDGRTAAEIAACLGCSVSAVRAFAAKHGMLVSRSAASVRRAVTVSADREEALRRLAADGRMPPAEAIEALIRFALDEDGAIARRVLHVARKPAREKPAAVE
jgi:hypothetical protein